ncbi:hypothetical protein Ahia01_001001500 [Argonauta hians]
MLLDDQSVIAEINNFVNGGNFLDNDAGHLIDILDGQWPDLPDIAEFDNNSNTTNNNNNNDNNQLLGSPEEDSEASEISPVVPPTGLLPLPSSHFNYADFLDFPLFPSPIPSSDPIDSTTLSSYLPLTGDYLPVDPADLTSIHAAIDSAESSTRSNEIGHGSHSDFPTTATTSAITSTRTDSDVLRAVEEDHIYHAVERRGRGRRPKRPVQLVIEPEESPKKRSARGRKPKSKGKPGRPRKNTPNVTVVEPKLLKSPKATKRKGRPPKDRTTLTPMSLFNNGSNDILTEINTNTAVSKTVRNNSNNTSKAKYGTKENNTTTPALVHTSPFSVSTNGPLKAGTTTITTTDQGSIWTYSSSALSRTANTSTSQKRKRWSAKCTVNKGAPRASSQKPQSSSSSTSSSRQLLPLPSVSSLLPCDLSPPSSSPDSSSQQRSRSSSSSSISSSLIPMVDSVMDSDDVFTTCMQGHSSRMMAINRTSIASYALTANSSAPTSVIITPPLSSSQSSPGLSSSPVSWPPSPYTQISGATGTTQSKKSGNTTKSKRRKCMTSLEKEVHNELERKRRAQMSDLLTELQGVVTSVKEDSKASQKRIVDEAFLEIEKLKQESMTKEHTLAFLKLKHHAFQQRLEELKAELDMDSSESVIVEDSDDDEENVNSDEDYYFDDDDDENTLVEIM